MESLKLLTTTFLISLMIILIIHQNITPMTAAIITTTTSYQQGISHATKQQQRGRGRRRQRFPSPVMDCSLMRPSPSSMAISRRWTNHDRFHQFYYLSVSSTNDHDSNDDSENINTLSNNDEIYNIDNYYNDTNNGRKNTTINNNITSTSSSTSSIDGNNNNNNNKYKPSKNILERMMINPFQAGRSFRSKVESAIGLASAITNEPAARLSPDRRSIYYNYYVDDKLGLSSLELKDDDPVTMTMTTPTTTSSFRLSISEDDDYRPEVLVVGASGALGRILVKRLLLENRVRVRVLVRDLYSSTLEKLGTGVTYCQGDLLDMESLEYAVTDVDKIVFCASGRRRRSISTSTIRHSQTNPNPNGMNSAAVTKNEMQDWEDLESILQQRSLDAQMVDKVGLRNLLHAYLNVRHADYGTSQTAKRVLFKFGKRPTDFDLFTIDDGFVVSGSNSKLTNNTDRQDKSMDETNAYAARSSYSIAATVSQCYWRANKFGHGVFMGKVGKYGEAAIVSARLRSRNDPEQGIDLRSGGFAGFVCRVCSDGGLFEAFVRTEAYDRLGIEYVNEFKTSAKFHASSEENNKSRSKWSTVRLEFSDFRARMRQFQTQEGMDGQRLRKAIGKSDIPPFTGRDIRQLGFRYRGKSNSASWGGASNTGWSQFYIALDYIKVYRGQPEPEFVYLSDARIPPVVNDAMVRHDLQRLVASSLDSSVSVSILDEESAKNVYEDQSYRIAEETYYKYLGEEMIKKSGLSYTIIRVAGYNSDLGTDSSTVRLQKMNKDITSISRVDLAQVISSALVAKNACNLIIYMTKAKQRGVLDGDIWQKFARLRSESVTEPFQ